MEAMRSLRLGLLFPALVLVGREDSRGQGSTASYGLGYGLNFSNIAARFTYRGSYPDIRQVDFKNLEIQFFGKEGRSVRAAQLKNGSFKHSEMDGKTFLGAEELTLESVHYLTPPGVEPGLAVVLLKDFSVSGSSSQDEIAQVFEVSRRRLRVEQELQSDEHFSDSFPAHSFDESTKTLVMETTHYLQGDAHCCVSAKDVITLRWTGTRFEQASLQTELTETGRSEGKKLTR